jgi:hypothetical protein
LLAALAGMVAVPGCATLPGSQGADDRLPPFLVRMQQTYPELAAGRFVSLAHFETPAQAELFRVVNADGETARQPQPEISVVRARNETGSGGLAAFLEAPERALRLDAVRSDRLALIRDWSEYALLVFSLYGPPAGQQLRFTIAAGPEQQQRFERVIAVPPGWTTFRFDLAEVGEAIDLANVQYLAWEPADPAARNVELYVDDVVLTDNTRYLQGEPEAPDEQLFVYEQGRRIHVGVAGRFELAFRDGLITGWFGPAATDATPRAAAPRAIDFPADRDEATDDTTPAFPRLNLTVGAGLGPHPVPLPDDWTQDPGRLPSYDDPALFRRWGPVVVAEQRLVELSPQRVILQGQWRFGQAGAPPTPDAPTHLWQHVIYPDGAVYVLQSSDAAAAGWPHPTVGYAVVVRGRLGFDFVHTAPNGASAGHAVLLAREGAAADLLWCPADPALVGGAVWLASLGERRQAALVGGQSAEPLIETAHLLRCWPNDLHGAPEAEALALAYQQPAAVTAEFGQVVTTQAGDLDRDGFNEGEGLYELGLRDGRFRGRIDPGVVLRPGLRLRVAETRDHDCWVYVDGQRVETVYRDRDGNLIVTLPGVVTRPLGVEIHTQPRDATGAGPAS